MDERRCVIVRVAGHPADFPREFSLLTILRETLAPRWRTFSTSISSSSWSTGTDRCSFEYFFFCEQDTSQEELTEFKNQLEAAFKKALEGANERRSAFLEVYVRL